MIHYKLETLIRRKHQPSIANAKQIIQTCVATITRRKFKIAIKQILLIKSKYPHRFDAPPSRTQKYYGDRIGNERDSYDFLLY